MKNLMMGLDLSLKRTGFAMGWTHEQEPFAIRSLQSNPRQEPLDRISGHVDFVVNQVMMFENEFDNLVLVVESPFLVQNVRARGAHYVYWLHGAVRHQLWVKHRPTIFEVAVPTLKKFATGNGKADKSDMIAASKMDLNDDQADAYWLFRYGSWLWSQD